MSQTGPWILEFLIRMSFALKSPGFHAAFVPWHSKQIWEIQKVTSNPGQNCRENQKFPANVVSIRYADFSWSVPNLVSDRDV